MYKKVACIHNPATGREQSLPQVVVPAEQAGRHVVIVGGGPAGLEAARVAAERGHRVVLFEAASRLGGQLLIAVRATWRRDLVAIVDWRAAELTRLGVDVRLNAYASVDDVLAEAPDVVIIATGGLPDLDGLEGAAHCSSVWDVLTAGEAGRGDVLIYDGTGRHQAVSCALHLAEQGRDVQFVTIDDNIGLEMEYSARVVYRKRFSQNGVRSLIDHQLLGVQPHGNQLRARFRHELTGAVTELTASQVVVERGTVPVDEMFHALRIRSTNDGVTDIDALLALQAQPASGPGFALHRIGDAVSSRNVHAAIYDALRLCSAL
jgi:thioredoxin reductase